jgi:hypothetical protein
MVVAMPFSALELVYSLLGLVDETMKALRHYPPVAFDSSVCRSVSFESKGAAVCLVRHSCRLEPFSPPWYRHAAI